MRQVREISVLAQHGSTVASGGTTTATGIDFTTTYEPYGKYVLNVNANATGAVVATVEHGTALASGYTTLGTISAGTVAGVYTLELGSITNRYLRSTITATGGTASVAGVVLATALTKTL